MLVHLALSCVIICLDVFSLLMYFVIICFCIFSPRLVGWVLRHGYFAGGVGSTEFTHDSWLDILDVPRQALPTFTPQTSPTDG